MNDHDPTALDALYQKARESARELVTLVKVAEGYGDGADPGGHIIRGQVRQMVSDNTDAQTWLLVEVLVRAVAATYEDLDDWSASVIEAVATEGDTP